MSVEVTEISGVRYAVLAVDGPLLDSEQAALDLIGEAWGIEADRIVIPKMRLAPEFFDLSSGLLGQITQKFVNYNVAVGFIGDFSGESEASRAFRDYLRETNKGRAMLFADDVTGLAGLNAAS